MLERYILEKRKDREILLMTHLVLGYPSFEASMDLVLAMEDAGVDLIELQIPFSEPMADGPVILHANQGALEAGSTVDRCLQFAEEAAGRVKVPLMFMTYYNVLFKRGTAKFVNEAKAAGMTGAIVPDLPPEEAGEYVQLMKEAEMDPIFIFSPNSTDARMKELQASARGFIYCVARKGVTGQSTEFSADISEYLARCRQATSLPLAVGFGVKNRADVDYLIGKADVAVVGSQTIRVVEEQGVGAVGGFLKSLRG